jgi:hypothetical protein
MPEDGTSELTEVLDELLGNHPSFRPRAWFIPAFGNAID